MKVRDIIKLIEADGWHRVDIQEVIGNTNMPQKLAELLSLDIPMMI